MMRDRLKPISSNRQRSSTSAGSETAWGKTIKTEVLIIGSGLAGLLTAILLFDAGARVAIASKSTFVDSNTSLAQGGLAAILKDTSSDSFSHTSRRHAQVWCRVDRARSRQPDHRRCTRLGARFGQTGHRLRSHR